MFTKRTLRFAWHLTTVAWWGAAAALLALGVGSPRLAVQGLSATFHLVLRYCGPWLHRLPSLLAALGRRTYALRWSRFSVDGDAVGWLSLSRVCCVTLSNAVNQRCLMLDVPAQAMGRPSLPKRRRRTNVPNGRRPWPG